MAVAGRRNLFLSPLWGTPTSLKASSVSVFGKHTRTKLYDQLLPRNQDLIQQLFLSVLIPHAYPVSGADELNGGVPLKRCQWNLGLDH